MPAVALQPSDVELLENYLSLPAKQRDEQFIDTSRAAKMVGLSQRTIQFWIESGNIRAIFLGGKYKVFVESMKHYLKTRLQQFDE